MWSKWKRVEEFISFFVFLESFDITYRNVEESQESLELGLSKIYPRKMYMHNVLEDKSNRS